MAFCGNVSKTETGKTVNSGWFSCVRCKSKSPYIAEDAALETMKEIQDEALLMAIIRTEEKNRVLTLEEARNAEVDTFGTTMHWFELKISPYICQGEEIKHVVLAVSMFFEDQSEDGEPDVMYACTGEPDAWQYQKDYGKRWRCWLRKPTKEEMEGRPWEN